MADIDVFVHTHMNEARDAYRVFIGIEGREIQLTPDHAMQHAAGVLRCVARAEHDAAVFKQLATLLKDKETAVMFVAKELRGDRPPLDEVATDPLSLEPGITETFEPFVKVAVNDQDQGTWTIDDARSHALTVIQAVEMADLDSAYLRALRGVIGLELGPASGAVAGLGELINPTKTPPKKRSNRSKKKKRR